MYKNLISEMEQSGIKTKDFAKALGISEQEAERKLYRIGIMEDGFCSQFYANEMDIIQKQFFPSLPYEYLFFGKDKPFDCFD